MPCCCASNLHSCAVLWYRLGGAAWQGSRLRLPSAIVECNNTQVYYHHFLVKTDGQRKPEDIKCAYVSFCCEMMLESSGMQQYAVIRNDE